jgi:hypothetical protein
VSIRKILTVALALAALAVTATACSGSGGSSGGSSPGGGSETYANDDYGFSLTYDTMFTQGTQSGGSETGAGSVFDIAFVDTNGTKIGGKYVDGILVSVYELSRELKASEVPGLREEVDGVVAQMMDSLDSATVTVPLADTTVNGVPGFKLSYTFVQEGTEVTATTYFLFSGKDEYELTGQAGTQKWNELSPALDAAIQSFTVK